MIGAVGGVCREMVLKYGIRTEDMLLLWDGLRASTDEAARSGFREGFRMAQAVLGNGSETDPAENQVPDEGMEKQEPVLGYEEAFVRMEQGKNGKKLHFNKAAGGMFGAYRKADIFVKNGNLFIYPTNDGAYTVTRSGTAGHVQICCADVLDELVTQGGNYPVEKRDNHIVARASIR